MLTEVIWCDIIYRQGRHLFEQDGRSVFRILEETPIERWKNMTAQEFKSYTRGIANSAIKLEEGLITPEQHVLDLRVILGDDTFDETKEIIKKHKNKQ